MTRPVDDGAPARLFDVDQLQLRPTGMARFRTLSTRRRRPATAAEMRSDENDKTIDQLRKWGDELAERHKLRWKALILEPISLNRH